MKLIKKSALILGLLSSAVVANEYSSPLNNIKVFKTKSSTLSIQNYSNQNVEIDLYGEIFNLTAASGIQFECTGYDTLELQIKNNDHEYFEVPCMSRVVFTESFTNQYMQGK
jgi:hypothetical protein